MGSVSSRLAVAGSISALSGYRHWCQDRIPARSGPIEYVRQGSYRGIMFAMISSRKARAA